MENQDHESTPDQAPIPPDPAEMAHAIGQSTSMGVDANRLHSIGRQICPACGGPLIEVRAKLQCTQCRRICESCCEGGPG